MRFVMCFLLVGVACACSERREPPPPAHAQGAAPAPAAATAPAPAPAPAASAPTCTTFARRWVEHEGVDKAAALMLTSACQEAGDLGAHRAEVECYLAAPTAADAKKCNVRPMVDAWFASRD